MLKRAEGLLKAPFKLIPIVVFGILLTAAVNIIITKINYTETQERFDVVKEENREDIWEEIESLITTSYYSNKLTTSYIALGIENQIIKQYPDLNVLEKEFEQGKLGEKFHTIIKEELDHNDHKTQEKPYLTLVGSRDELILTSTNTENNIMKYINTDKAISWTDIAKMTPNEKLTRVALESVFNKSGWVTFMQTSNRYTKDPVGYEMSIKTLRNVYDKEGIKGLYDFSIITPGFITETGDVFGVSDRYYLSKNQNYKLVVMQVISLESILAGHSEAISLKIDNNNMEERGIESFMLQQLVTTSTISLMLFILSCILIAVHNAETDRCRKESNADS